MKVVVAPNAFKGSLTAAQAAEAITRGVERADPACNVVSVPVADGGDGLVRVLARVMNGEIRVAEATDPLNRPVRATYLWLNDPALAVMEMAEVSGLTLLDPSERDPTRTSTLGTGELIQEILKADPKGIIIGIGGSATCDGGAGMAQALGIRFLEKSGALVNPAGGSLKRIDRIDTRGLDPRLKNVKIEAACDVVNPLLGDNGAAKVYGPQKGATPEQVELLEEGLHHLAHLIFRDLGIDVTALKGGGAAGGLGAGLFAFLGAELRSGSDVVLDLVGFTAALSGADLVLTGEGALDPQTLSGKAPAGVAAGARKKGIPCIALAGTIACSLEELEKAGFSSAFPISRKLDDVESAMAGASYLLTDTAEQVVRAYMAGLKNR
jgi:glycerate kinase